MVPEENPFPMMRNTGSASQDTGPAAVPVDTMIRHDSRKLADVVGRLRPEKWERGHRTQVGSRPGLFAVSFFRHPGSGKNENGVQIRRMTRVIYPIRCSWNTMEPGQNSVSGTGGGKAGRQHQCGQDFIGKAVPVSSWACLQIRIPLYFRCKG